MSAKHSDDCAMVSGTETVCSCGASSRPGRPDKSDLLALAQRAKELGSLANELRLSFILEKWGKWRNHSTALGEIANALPLLAEGVLELTRALSAAELLAKLKGAEARLADVERARARDVKHWQECATHNSFRADKAEAERDALREQLAREREKIERWIARDHEKRSAARKRAEEAALTPPPEETKT